MFKTFINAFKVKDVRRKIFYVLMMLVVIRLGSQMPVPGVNTSFFANYFANNTNEAFSFLNAFTGGGFDTPGLSAYPRKDPFRNHDSDRRVRL